MAVPHNVIELEMLLKAYYSAEYMPEKSNAHTEALDRLLRSDMAQWVGVSGAISTSLRGQFYVEHLLTIPFPVQSFSIPETK